MSFEEIALEDAFTFHNGKAPDLDNDGEFCVFGSNGKIGLSKEFNYENALIIGRVGAYCGSIEYSFIPFWASDNTIVIKPKFNQNLKYWFYRLKNYPLRSYAGGSAQPLLTQGTLKPIKLFVHNDENTQKQIVSMLEQYDNLIENNTRRIQILEESARLLYQEWFVYLRFPGHEQVKISDNIPDGWVTKPLLNLCVDIREAVKPQEVKADTPYIGLEHIPRRSITLSDWDFAAKVSSNKFRFQKYDIIFGKIRPYFHKVGFAICDGITSSDSIVIRTIDEAYYHYLLMYLSSDYFVSLASKTCKEGSKMPRADWKYLRTTEVLVPENGLLKQFSAQLKVIMSQLEALAKYNQSLVQARDLLLPKLMSGEISM